MPDQMSHPQLRPEDAATACAGCGHPASVHEVGVDEWRCLIGNCACAGFNQIELVPNPPVPIEVVGTDPATAAALAAARQRLDTGEMDDAIAAGVEAAAAALDAGEDPVAATVAAMTAEPPAPEPGALPVRRRTPPPRPKPTPPKRPEGIALRFARSVAANPPPPGEWVRLDQKVSRAIVNQAAREFAEAFGLKLSVLLDHEDPDDPTSPRYHHLFCQVLDDTDDVTIEAAR